MIFCFAKRSDALRIGGSDSGEFAMRWTILILSVVVSCLMLAGAAKGQAVGTPPFFSSTGVAAFEPQVSTVFSGEFIGQQAVVSHDLKYVTINTQATSSRLLAL